MEPRHKRAAERLEKDKYFEQSDVVSECSMFELDNSDVSQDSPVEYCENRSCVRVKGRLRSHISFWESIGAPRFILDTLSRGYIIPFLTTPTSAFFNNNKSAFEHSKFVQTAISDLIDSGSVIECHSARQ